MSPAHDRPFASVLIPAFNAASSIGETLNSLLGQTMSAFDVVIVDDGSADATAAICRDFVRDHPSLRATVMTQANAGQAAARNAGARIASGQWFALLDADDLWMPDKLAAVAETAASVPNAAVVCHDMLVRQHEGPLRHRRCRPPLPISFENLLFASENPIFASGTAIRADVFRAAGGFTEDRALQGVEDYDLWLRLAKRGEPFVFIDRPLGVYSKGETTQAVREHAAHKLALLDRHAGQCRGDAQAIDRARRRRRAHIFYQAGKALWRQRQRQAAMTAMLTAVREHPRDSAVIRQTAGHAARAFRRWLRPHLSA